MRIGLDFDNTIVNYDRLFHKAAVEQGLVPATIAQNKLAVRNYLRECNCEDQWTELQGYVYGARMDEADAYSGVLDFIRRAQDAGHELSIISHKTRYPFLGLPYDLHAAAKGWIDHYLVDKGQPLLADNRIFFELTKVEKLARIAQVSCNLFIDDLPEILLADDFPQQTGRLLFDPDRHHKENGLDYADSWHTISHLVLN
jgi:hypothetical protein